MLVRYLHAAAGFPVKPTWLATIKAGNYSSWSGLTYANASKYCHISIETLQGHLKQTRQCVRSTKHARPCAYTEMTKPNSVPVTTSNPSNPLPTFNPNPPPPVQSKEFYVQIEPKRKLYTYDMGRFLVRSCNGNYYIISTYWASDLRVPHYILLMEEAHNKKAARAELPISGFWIAAFATSSFLLANLFPNDPPVWDGKLKSTQTWQA